MYILCLPVSGSGTDSGARQQTLGKTSTGHPEVYESQTEPVSLMCHVESVSFLFRDVIRIEGSPRCFTAGVCETRRLQKTFLQLMSTAKRPLNIGLHPSRVSLCGQGKVVGQTQLIRMGRGRFRIRTLLFCTVESPLAHLRGTRENADIRSLLR